jgi:transposase, IS30 family
VGTDTSTVGTLIEHSTRFVMLLALPNGRTAAAVNAALIDRIQQLHQALKGSLTWDRGAELAGHKAFTVATGVRACFCDPRSPWQRGSNENPNGLLRPYLPRSMNLSTATQADLDGIAEQLNTRPRKTPRPADASPCAGQGVEVIP